MDREGWSRWKEVNRLRREEKERQQRERKKFKQYAQPQPAVKQRKCKMLKSMRVASSEDAPLDEWIPGQQEDQGRGGL